MKIHVFFVGMALLCFGLSCSNPSKDVGVSNAATVGADTVAIEPIAMKNWEYANEVDKMEGDSNYFAYTNSTNQLEFEFPYHGGSTFQLVVRKIRGKEDVMLRVDRGQFIGNLMGDESLKLKFDDGKPISWSFSNAADGSSDMIFPDKPKALIKATKSATKLMIEAPFFNEGRQVIEFDVAGLEW